MKRTIVLALITFSLFLAGCGKKEPEIGPLGADAPAFGTGSNSTIDKFVVGQWCLVSDQEGAMKSRYYTFKEDGTFECGGPQDHWKSTGKWKASGDVVALSYDTMNGKPYLAFRDQYKKEEEGGGQVSINRALVYDSLYDQQLPKLATVWVDTDKTHLSFTDPKAAAPAAGEGGDLGAMIAKIDKYQLERMGPKTSA
jgi:hypothetical protein